MGPAAAAMSCRPNSPAARRAWRRSARRRRRWSSRPARGPTQGAIDVQQLVPMLEQVERNVGQRPAVVMADAGYFSAANLTSAAVAGIDLYVPPDKQRRDTPRLAATKQCRTAMAEAMRAK